MMNTETEPPRTGTPAAQLADAIATLLSGAMGAEAEGTVVKLDAAGIKFELIVIEADNDPLRRVKSGDAITVSDRFPTKRATMSNMCKARNPNGSDYTCGREEGHSGKHFSVRHDRVYEEWTNRSPGSVPADPLSHVKPGDATDGLREHLDGGCSAYNGQQWYCSRSHDHPGIHVASGGMYVLDTWGGTRSEPKDLLRGVETGDTDPTADYSRRYMDFCDYDVRGDGCTRGAGHIGQHICGIDGVVNDCEERE